MSNQLALLPPDVMPTEVADKDCWQTPPFLRQFIQAFAPLGLCVEVAA